MYVYSSVPILRPMFSLDVYVGLLMRFFSQNENIGSPGPRGKSILTFEFASQEPSFASNLTLNFRGGHTLQASQGRDRLPA